MDVPKKVLQVEEETLVEDDFIVVDKKSTILTDTITKVKNTFNQTFSTNGDLNHITKFYTQFFIKEKPTASDTLLNFIKSKGYPAEKHQVVTEDGFIIELHRIRHGRDEYLKKFVNEEVSEEEMQKRKNAKRPVVYLQHGILNSSATWVLTGPDQALGFLLADSGYDVWLGNNRGTQFGSRHVSLNKKQSSFWNWSFADMGKYDLPAQIEYVLKYTKNEKLTYIGHSQGCTQALIGFSINPKLQSKINLFIALAPVATLKYHTSKVFKYIMQWQPEKILNTLGIGEVLHNEVSKSLLPHVAYWMPKVSPVHMLWSYVCDCDLDPAVIPTLTALEPSPTSLHNLSHWCQLTRCGKFCAFDYGETENIRLYGKKTPPVYDISKITIPVAVFHGDKDFLCTEADLKYFLLPNLPNKVHVQLIENFTHNDFVWGRLARTKVYLFVLRLLVKYTLTPDKIVKEKKESEQLTVDQLRQKSTENFIEKIQNDAEKSHNDEANVIIEKSELSNEKN